MNYKELRRTIQTHLNSFESNKLFLTQSIGIDVTRDGKFKVRKDERTPSCVINKDGSFHDYGSGRHYIDIVSLVYDGYNAFDSLPSTMKWVCEELNIDWEAYREDA